MMTTDTSRFSRRLVLFLGTLFFTAAAYAQTCQPVNGACPSPTGLTCTFAATIEKGCNCYDGKDNDGDGLIDTNDGDCVPYVGGTYVGTGSGCSLPPPGGDVFATLTENTKISSAQNTSDTPSHVAVGDIDGDGVPDGVVTQKFAANLNVFSTIDGTPIGKGYNTSGSPLLGSNWTFEHEVTIANIDPSVDKYGEIFVIASDRGAGRKGIATQYMLCGFKFVPGNFLSPIFGKTLPDALGQNIRPGSPGIADFDGDGFAEVYVRNKIFAAENGTLLADAGGNWLTDINSGSVAVDMDGDGILELVCGPLIYKIPAGGFKSRSLQTLTVWKDLNSLGLGPKVYPKGFLDSNEYSYGHASTTSVADFDVDGYIDVLITGAVNCSGNEGPVATPGKTACSNPITTIFYWNIHKNTLQTYTPPDVNVDGTPGFANGWKWGTGRVNLYDVYPNHEGLEALFMAGSRLFCLDNSSFTTGNTLWIRATPNDALSGILSITCYDFNNDGDPEVVFRDTQQLVVCDGKTGGPLSWHLTSGAPSEFFYPCQSHTFTEGPLIVDVDGNGATDICIPCYRNTGKGSFDVTNATPQQQSLGAFIVLPGTISSWLPTRKVWNQHPYYVVNINDDLTLPNPQLGQSLIFGTAACSNGVQGPQRPLNLFMDQVPRLGAGGCPEFPAPDITYYGDTPNSSCGAVGSTSPPAGCDTNGDGKYQPTVVVIPPICGNLGISVYFNIVNNGELGITDKIPVSFFNGDPTANPVTAKKLYDTTMSVTNLAIGATYTSPTYKFDGPGSTFTLYIVIYNDGKTLPISLTGSSTKECTISNNMYSTVISPSPFTVTTEVVQNNTNCPPYLVGNNGQVKSHVFIGATEVASLANYSFQWYDASGNPISGATLYNLSNLDAGTYQVQVKDNTKGCSSALVPVTVTRSQPTFPPFDVTVTTQTQCSPANGEAIISPHDGSTGYTYKWLDNALNPIGVSGADAKNLTAGTYKIQITRGTCVCADAQGNPCASASVSGPTLPDAKATPLADVTDCLNPNNGSVTADAYLGSTVQPAANYTFDWYFYNTSTNTRGSLLPAANGTGQTRTGLAAGTYQVVITDNATKCTANSSPTATVGTTTVTPSVTINPNGTQTSCDPTQPNGSLIAVASGTGLTNPTSFKFEWFRGDNTLPANLIPIAGGPEATSGTKGEILIKASGGGVVYTVKATTALNCTATYKLTVPELKTKPSVVLGEVDNTVCDPSKTNPSIAYNGSVTATVTFGSATPVTFPDPNYVFNWYDGSTTTTAHSPPTSTTATLNGLQDTKNYTVVVTKTDVHCSSDPQTIAVGKNTTPPSLSPTATGSNNCDASLTPDGTVSVSVDPNAKTTGHSYTFQWYSGNAVDPTKKLGAANNGFCNTGTSCTAIKVGGPTGLAGTPYTVYVLDQTNGCDQSTNQSVPDNSKLPVLSAVASPNSICAPASAFNGTLKVSLTNPVGAAVYPTDFSFTWYNSNVVDPLKVVGTTNPGTASTTSDLAAKTITLNTLDIGDYAVVGKNKLTGCTSVVVTDKVITAQIKPILKPLYTGSNNCDVNLLPDGTASYDVTNISSFTGTFTQQWYYDDAVDPLKKVPVAVYNGTSKIAQHLGGPYKPAKDYTVEVTNSVTGCSSFTTATVPDNSVVPVLLTDVVGNSVCDLSLGFKGQFIASLKNPIAGYTFPTDFQMTWKDNTGAVITPQAPPTNLPYTSTDLTLNTITLNNLDSKSFSVVAFNPTTGCTSTAANNTVPNAKTFPTLVPTSTASNNCTTGATVFDGTSVNVTNDGTATVTASGTAGAPNNYSYLWFKGQIDLSDYPTNQHVADQFSPAETSKTVNNVGGPGGTHHYTVFVKDQVTGCTAFTYADVGDGHKEPELSPLASPNAICDPAKGLTGSLQATLAKAQVVGVFPTDYLFTWWNADAAGNQVSQIASPTTTTAVGSITMTKLDVGTYAVVGFNKKTGCQTLNPQAYDAVTDSKAYPDVSIVTVGSHNCSNVGITPDGTATATITPIGAHTFSYAWSPTGTAPAGTSAAPVNTTSPTITSTIKNLGGPNAPALSTWVYKLIVTDDQTGCATTKFPQVSDESQKPSFTLKPFENTVCDPTVITPGAKNYNGHVDVDLTTLKSNIAADYTGGATTFKYSYTDVTTLPATGHPFAASGLTTSTTYTLLPSGDYEGTVTIPELGCTSDPEPAHVNDNFPHPAIVTSVTPNPNCVGFLGKASVATVDGNNAPSHYSYQWYDGALLNTIRAGETTFNLANGAKFQGTKAGQDFSVLVTDLTNGCTNNAGVTIFDTSVKPTITVSLVQNNDICVVSLPGTPPDGKLIATATNYGVNYNIQWSDVGGVSTASEATATTTLTGDTFTKLAAAASGNYTAQITDTDTGCKSLTDTHSIIDSFTYPALAIAETDQTSCSTTPNGKLVATADGLNDNTKYSYVWADVTAPPPATPFGGLETDDTQGTLDIIPTGDYQITVTKLSNGCVSVLTKHVTQTITNPVIDITGVGAVTKCDNPDGSASISIVSGLSGNADIYSTYTTTASGNTPPSTKAAIPLSTPNDDLNTNSPEVYSSTLEPGYLSAYIVDRTTKCESAIITKQISNNTVKSTITLATIPSPGVCGVGNGGIDATITTTPPAVYTSTDYRYYWYRGTPNNPPGTISFFGTANLPTFAGVPPQDIYQDQGPPNLSQPHLGINRTVPDASIGPDVYTLVVFDPNGCGAYKTDAVPTQTAPDIVMTPSPRTKCDSNDGSMTVVVNSVVAGSKYYIELFEGNDDTGTSKGSIPLTSPAGTPLTVNNLKEGPYFARVIDNANQGCPIGKGESITKIVLPPIVTLGTIGANTSCSPSASADGSIQITVTDDANDTYTAVKGLQKDYEVTSVAPAPVGYTIPPNQVVGNGHSGQSTTIIKLPPVSYTITVTDLQSNCATTITPSVPDQQDTPDALSVLITPETSCAPASVGSAFASLTSGENPSELDFTWYKDAAKTMTVYGAQAGTGYFTGTITSATGSMSVTGTGTQFTTELAVNDILTDATGNVIGTVAAIGTNTSLTLSANAKITVAGGLFSNTAGGQEIQQSKVAAANWTMGTTGQGSGTRTYFLQGVKNASAPTGAGCKTDFKQVDIPDTHIAPSMSLATAFNSYCAPTPAPGSVPGDGKILVTTNGNGAPDPGGLGFSTSPAYTSSAAPVYNIENLGTGSYPVVATNLANDCQVSNTATIDPAPYTYTIDSKTVIDQRICNNDGRIKITQVSLIDNSATPPTVTSVTDTDFPGADSRTLQASYDFSWYTDAALTIILNGVGMSPITQQVLSNDSDEDLITGENGDYISMGSGTYYVTATRNDPTKVGYGCTSLPITVDVNKVNKNPSPDPIILSDTSCDPTAPAEGEMKIVVTDATAAPYSGGTYQYDWTGALQPTPDPLATPVPVTNNNPGAGDGDGSDADGDDDYYKELLAGTYNLKVTNLKTGCSTSITPTVLKNSVPVFVQDVTPTPQLKCDLVNGDGGLTVNKVSVNNRGGAVPSSTDYIVGPGAGQGDIKDFDFIWTRTTGAAAQTTTGAGGNVLEGPSGTGTYNAVTFGELIGADTYTVVAKRVKNAPGNGCSSDPFTVVIKDLRVNPTVTLTPFSNTSCSGTFEGEIIVKVADHTSATPPAGGFTFDYDWTGSPHPLSMMISTGNNGDEINNGAPADRDDEKGVQDDPAAYTLKVTNPTTLCFSNGTATVTKNSTPVFVESTKIVDPVLCQPNPDGSITVKSVSINVLVNGVSTVQTFYDPANPPSPIPASSSPTMLTDFQFEWQRVGDSNNYTEITNGGAAPLGATLDAGNYVQGAGGFNPILGVDAPGGTGTYTVVARRKNGTPGANCTSSPATVILQDKSVNPIVTLTPFANTSCDPNFFEGEIRVKVTDANPTTAVPAGGFKFDYTWTASAVPVQPGAPPFSPIVNGTTSFNNDGDELGNGDAALGGEVDPPGCVGAACPKDTDGDYIKDLKENDISAPATSFYTVSAKNQTTGCSAIGSTQIFRNSTPVFTQLVLAQPQVYCLPSGHLIVDEVQIKDKSGATLSTKSGGLLMTDFNFKYDRVIAGVTTNIPIATPANAYLDSTNYTNAMPPVGAGIGADTYYVTTTRVSGFPGKDCSSAPYKIDIEDRRIYPRPSLTPFSNTSCDVNFFEGEIRVNVSDATKVPAPAGGFKFDYLWTASAVPAAPPASPIVVGTTSSGNDGDGLGYGDATLNGETDPPGPKDTDGDYIKGLKENDTSVPATSYYTVQVTNTKTQCPAVGSTQIFRNSTPVFTQKVIAQPQVFCNPSGHLIVKEVKIIDRNGLPQSNLNTPPDFPLSNFNFTFDRATIGNTVFTDVGDNAPHLDSLNYPGPVPNNLFDTYYVTATRVSGSPGKNCSSAPYKVDIDDRRVYPTVSFTAIANSTCPDPITGLWTKANGSITATASDPRRGQIDHFTFDWTRNGSAIPRPPDTSPTSALTNALDGAYIVTATDDSYTGCSFAASYNLLLDQTMSTPNIITVVPSKPIDCNPSANAQVTEITLGSTTNSSLFPPNIPPDNTITDPALLGLPRFEYTWYEGSLSNPITGANTNAPCIGANPPCNPGSVGLKSGDHFVTVIDHQTNCQSGPKEFQVLTDDIIYPMVGITQLVKQISCISGVGTGELQAAAVEQDGTIGTSYTFDWYPSLDLTGTALTSPYTKPDKITGLNIYNPDTLRQLLPGNYSVRVTNTITSCTAQALFIIPDEAPFFKPILSTGTAPQTFCVGVDGDAQVRILLDPAYPLLPYDNTTFTTDLFSGLTTPDLTSIPDVQANIPFTATGSSNAITYDVPQLVTGFYTFRVIDKNTNCFSTDSVHIRLDQRKPIIATHLDNPMRNCDPVIADGQLSAIVTATTNSDGSIVNKLDNGGTQGFTFDWFAGAGATGSILQTSDILTGQRAGTYTVRATDNVTGCFDAKTDSITSATVIPPVPDAITLHNQTSCVSPNGEVSASVDGATFGYSFQWYNGAYFDNAKLPSTVDYKFADYSGLNVGVYSVTATDDVTHCVSPPDTTSVLDQRVRPKFDVESTPSYCPDASNPTGTFTIISRSDVPFAQITWTLADTTQFVGVGTFINGLYPGDYHVLVTSSLGCEHSADVQIPTEVKPYNLVSTNNDGQNDMFIIDCIRDFPNNNVKIFNRNGTLVYEIDGYDNQTKFFRGVGEKGVYLSDKDLPEGTYFYIIDKRNGTKPKTGFIELVR